MPAGGTYGKALGWSVGSFAWLDNPASKVNRYWRVIEQGSDATDWPWAGRRVIGLWSNKATPRGGLIGPGLSPFENGRGNQKFVPFFADIDNSDARDAARAALYYFFEGGKGRNMELIRAVRPPTKREIGNGRPWDPDNARKRFYFWLMNYARVEDMPFVQGVIVRKIEAGHFYAKALGNFDPMQHEVEAMREVFSHILAPSGSSAAEPNSRLGLKRLREIQAFDDGDIAPKKGRRRAEKTPHTSRVRGRFAVSVNASVVLQDNIRNSRGQLSRLQAEVVEVNRRVAAAFQAEVVEVMQAERRRPATGELVKATADPRNRSTG